MSLIIATGTNLGDKRANLAQAKAALSEQFQFIAQSNIYSSPAIGYEDQPDFFNQALEFSIPECSPERVMRDLLKIEKEMGRLRNIKWGPRSIDLDIIFWGKREIESTELVIPHPRWAQRAFVVLPLRELPFFQVLRQSYKIPDEFNHKAEIVREPREADESHKGR